VFYQLMPVLSFNDFLVIIESLILEIYLGKFTCFAQDDWYLHHLQV
jgi:hypothetical protein